MRLGKSRKGLVSPVEGQINLHPLYSIIHPASRPSCNLPAQTNYFLAKRKVKLMGNNKDMVKDKDMVKMKAMDKVFNITTKAMVKFIKNITMAMVKVVKNITKAMVKVVKYITKAIVKIDKNIRLEF